MQDNMKKRYISPDTEVIAAEVSRLCANSKPTWHVDPNGEHTHQDGDTPGENWDWILYDKGEGNNGDYDAWDSANW